MTPAVLDIIEAAAAHYGVTPAEMLKRGHSRTKTRARFAAWKVLRTRHGWSFTEIGDEFNRDHSTIINGCRRADPAAVASIVRGLSVAGSPEPRGARFATPAEAARELGLQGPDLAHAANGALPDGAGVPRSGVHDQVVPRVRAHGGPAIPFSGDRTVEEVATAARRRPRGGGDQGIENEFGSLGLRALAGVGREMLVKMVKGAAR